MTGSLPPCSGEGPGLASAPNADGRRVHIGQRVVHVVRRRRRPRRTCHRAAGRGRGAEPRRLDWKEPGCLSGWAPRPWHPGGHRGPGSCGPGKGGGAPPPGPEASAAGARSSRSRPLAGGGGTPAGSASPRVGETRRGSGALGAGTRPVAVETEGAWRRPGRGLLRLGLSENQSDAGRSRGRPPSGRLEPAGPSPPDSRPPVPPEPPDLPAPGPPRVSPPPRLLRPSLPGVCAAPVALPAPLAQAPGSVQRAPSERGSARPCSLGTLPPGQVWGRRCASSLPRRCRKVRGAPD